MNFPHPAISEYAEKYSAKEPALLAELNRDTHANVLMPQMLSGSLQGRILSMFSKMIRPERVLEIGTFTGYAALCFAEGLADNGVIHTIEVNPEMEDRIRKYIDKAGMKQVILLHIGEAARIIPTLNETFDLVFIDADKENYSVYFDLVIDKVRKGGFIIADNVLWSGKVLDAAKTMDTDTKALAAYSKKVSSDPRVESVLLPVRDGLMISMKK